MDGGLLRSLGVLDGACAEVSHFGVFHFLLVQLVLSPQQQLQQFSQFRGRLPVFIVQDSLVYLTPHLCTHTYQDRCKNAQISQLPSSHI